MARSAAADKRAHEEAAAWFARLNRRSVPLQLLEDFRAWRQDPQNRAAYQAVESAWSEAAALTNDPDISDALAAALARRAPSRSARWAWPATVATAGLAVLTTFAALTFGAGSTYATRVGEQRLVRLEDGTTVRLDTDTRVTVAFRAGERRVQLAHGQAFFDVAHDATRPFIVDAGSMRVRAVGTRFDVRRDGADAKVTLVEGIVQVRGAGVSPGDWTLKPGEQVRLGHTPAHITADVVAATSWTGGRVIFRGLPLAEAIDEINRYSPHKIRLEAQAVAEVPVTGSFETGDVDAFVTAVSDLHGLIAKKSSDGTIVLDASSPSGT
jgi:transmembrane sensor